MIVSGKNVIYEALKANHKFHQINLSEKVAQKDNWVIEKIKELNIPLEILDFKIMDKKYGDSHQGYGASIADYRNYELTDVIKKDKKQLFLLLDKIQDPHNLGAILRSCDSFGVDAVILSKHHSVGITETVVKVSTGAIEYVPLVFVINLNQTIEKLKKEGFWIIGTDASADKSIYDIKMDTSLGLVIGSEGMGISQLVLKNCDYVVKIPTSGHVNSLNASVSAGICLSALKNNLA